jgi:DNA (cytosine-5)-methyltransferase 1
MNKTRLKVGTDFSGIGAPEMALNNLGIDYEQVFACEIDKHAKKSYLAIHGSPAKFYNDITQRNHKQVEQLDLYVAGFPCQAFSIAGQRKGFDDVRGTLFFDVAEFIRINQPKMFILENVKGLLSHDNGRTYQTITDILTNGGGTLNAQMSLDVFDDGLGYHCYAQVLNTKHYGIPQNRERIFIIGFKEFRDFSFPKKEPLKMRLKDMLQDNPKSKYIISDKWLNFILKQRKKRQSKNRFPLDVNDVSDTITARYSKGGAEDGFIPVNDKYFLSDKAVNYYYRNHEENQKKGNGFTFSPSDGDVIASSITTREGSRMENNYIKSERIRRLTPLECWRLQAFPDEAFYKANEVCSDTQLYKQAGNSISVNVIEKLLNKIL